MLQISISFEYKEYYRRCTRFFSKFDRDFGLNTVNLKDTRLKKRRYKLYKGFRKKELKAYTGKEVAKYFEGLNNTSDVVYIF